MKFLRKDKNLIEHYRASAAFTVFDLIAVALVVFAVTVCISALSPSEEAAYAYVYVDGKETGIYPLDSDRETYLLDGRVTLTIADGAIAVTDNDCPNGVCVKTGFISEAGERIVCVPNKISVVLRSEDGSDIYVTGGGGL